MRLRDYSDEDLWLTRALETDPEVMRDLGGPTPTEKVSQHHARRLKSTLAGTVWYFTIRPDESTGPVGTIGVWESDWKGAKINEMGWMILPAFQGRGLATQAGRLVLERARVERRWNTIHAFPYASNAASNAICRKLGFALVGEVEIAYNGPLHKAHDWKIDLS